MAKQRDSGSRRLAKRNAPAAPYVSRDNIAMAEQDDESTPAPTPAPAAKKPKKPKATASGDSSEPSDPSVETAVAATEAPEVSDTSGEIVNKIEAKSEEDEVSEPPVTETAPAAAAPPPPAPVVRGSDPAPAVAASDPAPAPAAVLGSDPAAVAVLGSDPAAVEACDFVDPRQVRDFMRENHLAETAEAPPGVAPRGPIRSLRRSGAGGVEEFVLIFSKANFLIRRTGIVGKRGTWTMIDYPSPASASFAYARECSDLTSEGFRDVH